MNKKNTIMNIIIIILITLSYFVIDYGIRYLSYDIHKFYYYKDLSPTLFSLGWITIFISIFYLLKPNVRKIFYITTLIISNLIALSQYLHLLCLGRLYSINDLFLIKEGTIYFTYALSKIDIKVLTIMGLSLLLSLIVLLLTKKYHETIRDKAYFTFNISISLVAATAFFTCAHFQLGYGEINAYDASFSPALAYQEFSDPNKTMQVSGLYENTSRGILTYITKKLNNNSKTLTKEINDYIKNNPKKLEQNEYTNIFKDKNLIIIQLESIDTFLVNEDVMPTLYKLSKEGLNFTNHYTPSFGGGQTINSEFALNTSLYTSLENNIYNLKNTYKTSLANMFKENNYIANSIHYNYGYYYNRKEFHKNLGFTNHYAISDMKNIDKENYNYEYDSNLIKNKEILDLIIPNNKFLTYITTFSTHLPYDLKNKKCLDNKHGYITSDGELSCIYNLAHDTDEMIRLLIEELEKKQILDNTVLVLVSDHYMYGYSKIEKIKNTNNPYLLQNTPLVIWNNNIEYKDIDIPVDTADILPTILNLFGINYNPNLYVGEDTFTKTRNNYIYFSEDIYYENNIIYDKTTNPGNMEIYKDIKETIKFNNNLINSNYLKAKD